MNQKASSAAAAHANRPMMILGVIVLCGVGFYFLFSAVNGIGLEDESGDATVVRKEYRESGTTYQRQVIGGRVHTQAQATPELYILMLDIDGQSAECAVTKSLYDELSETDRVSVEYQRKRITGSLLVTDVRP